MVEMNDIGLLIFFFSGIRKNNKKYEQKNKKLENKTITQKRETKRTAL